MRDRTKSLNSSVGSGLSNLLCVIRRAWPSQGRPRVPVPGELGLSCAPAASPGFLRGAICRSQLKRQARCVAAVLEGNGTATPEKKMTLSVLSQESLINLSLHSLTPLLFHNASPCWPRQLLGSQEGLPASSSRKGAGGDEALS